MARDEGLKQDEERNKKLDSLIQKMVEAKDEEAAAAEKLEASSKLNFVLQEKGNELSLDQSRAIEDLLDSMASEGQTAEQRKEDTARAEKLLTVLGDIADNTSELGNISGPVEAAGLSILSLPGLIIGLGAGLVAGIASSFATLVKIVSKGVIKAVAPIVKSVLGLWKALFGGVFKLLNKIPFVNNFVVAASKFFGNLASRFSNAGKAISKTFKPLTNGIKNIQRAFTAGFSGLKTFKDASGRFAKLGKIGNIGKGIAQGLKNIRGVVASIKNFVIAPFKQIGKDLAPIKKLLPGGGTSKIFKPAMDVIKRVMSVLRAVTKAAFTFGRTLGRLFLPITVIISVFDTFKGALAGFDKYKDQGFVEGIIGGTIGAVSGLLTGLIGMPLDLLKNGISWIASKLGFENFSEILDSFSFADLISNLFTSITDTIVGFIGSIKDSIANIGVVDTIGNIALELLKIFKKIATFPVAVAAGAAGALMNLFSDPAEGFTAGFSKVFNAGDESIDSMKVTGESSEAAGENIKALSEENAQGQAALNSNAGANTNVAAVDNSKRSSSTTTIFQSQPVNRIGMTTGGAYA